jgi:hypothetical protein
MSRFISLLAGLMLFAGIVRADATAPNSDLTPERVVEIQLTALQHNDDPRPDAGIERTWAFAHPDNKRITGPFERFAAMIKSPGYRALVGHRKHVIEPLARTVDIAVFVVTVVPESGALAAYQWKLEKVHSGSHVGAWMTIAVSPPLKSGQSI